MDTKQYVVELLKEYPSMVREIERLQFEVGNIKFPLLHGLAIQDMTFHGKGLEEKISRGGRTTDRTADIAIEHFDQQRNRAYISLQARLDRLNVSVKRLQLYMEELPKTESEAIHLVYWSELSWDEIEEKTGCAKTSMLRRKSHAIVKLSKMYKLLMELGVIIDDELF